jgi:hypothetical protein
MRGERRNILIPRNFPASLSIFVKEKQTHKDKPLPMDLFIPADFVCLRCVSSFRPVVDQRQDRAEPGAVIFT